MDWPTAGLEWLDETPGTDTDSGTDEPAPLLRVGLLAGMIGWLAFAFWDIPTIKLTAMFPFWALAGALVGYASKHGPFGVED